MHLSRYVTKYPCPDEPGYFLLFSTRHAATILVPEPVLTGIEDGTLDPSDRETLCELGFLVPDRDAEREEMRRIFEEANRRRRRFNAMVVMNLDCNLACTYCYEGGMKGRKYLSDETAQLLVEVIERDHLGRGKHVNLDFYGGEPLLSVDLIKRISSQLKESAEAKGLSFTFSLITNGTLLTGRMAEELKPFGLRSAKVTLDGPRENHDRFRPFVSGKGSFDTIIGNVREACEIIDIQIGGNFTRDNFREFPLLLDQLLDEGITLEKIDKVKFDPVTRTGGDYGLPEFNSGCVSIDEPWLIEAGMFLREEVLKRGYSTTKTQMAPCVIEFDDDIVINFDGSIYKCPGFLGWKELAVGDLKTGIKDFRESHALDNWKKDECLDCEYLPLCFGGCRFLKLIQDGVIDGVSCKKPYLDATLEANLRQDLTYLLNRPR